MEWYLNWLEKNEQLPEENKPIGIVLCAGKDQDDIEYMKMDGTGIHVAQYITELQPQKELEDRLIRAVREGKEVFERKSLK